jgi:hypothetical protein
MTVEDRLRRAVPPDAEAAHDGPGAVVRQDGTRVRVGTADGATWSPHGLFIAAWKQKELRAMEPDGDPRWRITAPATIRGAAWSPDGLRIAYIAGGRVRIVSGNGMNDHALIGGAARPVTPVWNPGRAQELTYVSAAGRVVARDVGTGRRVVAHRGHARATTSGGSLRIDGRAVLTVRGRLGRPVWSPDGRYVAVGRGTSVLIVSADGRRLSTVAGRAAYDWALPGS